MRKIGEIKNMKSCYIKGLVVSILAFYPTFELSRIIISYISGTHWVTEPFTFAILIEGKPWSIWCYIFELVMIWSCYFAVVFLTIWWDKKLFVEREKA